MSRGLTAAVFLDRDGTIIEDRGHLRSPSEVVFLPDTVPALTRLQEHFLLFVVTHQSGISSGLVTAAEVGQVNAHVTTFLRERGVHLSEVYCCPHRRDEQCCCIKPNPYHLRQAARDYQVDLTRSFVVGDHPHDVVLADNAGACGVYVRTGHGSKHLAEVRGRQAIVPGIREAADWILACREMQRQQVLHPAWLDEAAGLLRNGGIVAFPTETVYGLGAAAFDPKAVARIFEAKGRPRFDPLIVHVSGPEQVRLLTDGIPPVAQALIEQFWPGPLTLVLPKAAAVPDLVTAGLPTVAIRMPRHPLALELIRRAGTPVAAPSANAFGFTSPTNVRHVLDHLAGKVDMVLDGGSCPVGIESTIVSLAGESPLLLRPGGIPAEDIEAVTGPLARASHNGSGTVAAPGMLPRHYAPRTPLTIAGSGEPPSPEAGKKVGVLAFRGIASPSRFAAVEILSPGGDLREAAANLFGAIRRLDERRLDGIVAQTVPETGLGLAINDRLARAAGKDECR